MTFTDSLDVTTRSIQHGPRVSRACGRSALSAREHRTRKGMHLQHSIQSLHPITPIISLPSHRMPATSTRRHDCLRPRSDPSISLCTNQRSASHHKMNLIQTQHSDTVILIQTTPPRRTTIERGRSQLSGSRACPDRAVVLVASRTVLQEKHLSQPVTSLSKSLLSQPLPVVALCQSPESRSVA